MNSIVADRQDSDSRQIGCSEVGNRLHVGTESDPFAAAATSHNSPKPLWRSA